MNMFRDLGILAFMALGLGLTLSDPTTWPISPLGTYIVSYLEPTLQVLKEFEPFSIIFSYVLALTLFMTRIKY